MADCYERGGNTTPARVFFSFFFFSFSFLFRLPVHCSGLGGGQVGGWVEEKKKEIFGSRSEYSTSTALYSIVPQPTSSFFLPNCGLPCRKMHGHLGRRTWNYGRFVCEPPDPSPFPYSCCHQVSRHTYKSTSFTSRVRTRKSAIFIFFLRRRPYSPDRQSKPSFSLLLIRKSRRLPPAVDPLPHLPQFPPHKPSDEH